MNWDTAIVISFIGAFSIAFSIAFYLDRKDKNEEVGRR